MASDLREAAKTNWATVGKVRQAIAQKIDELHPDPRVTVNYTLRLEQIETLIKQLRLACVTTIFADFSFAREHDVETILWQTHTSFNNAYRKVLGRIGDRSQVVQKRKVDKLYRDFLKTSQSFYRAYVQRLASQYDIPELRQAAHGLELETESNASPESLPPALRSQLLGSCYMTLVRLGDLARYRCQHSERASKSSFDTAMTFYGLASMLDPHDGSCHHQMAVLHQQQGQQLDVIYRFHRSISILKPYALGPSNLDRALERYETPSNSRRGSSRDPSDAMTIWFLRLHASYAKGAAFAAKEELEKEVLHRLEMAVKAEEGDEGVVLKMILVNMAAYDIAMEKVKDKWSEQRSKSCEYLLNFNMRTILVLVRQLRNALQADAATTPIAQAAEGESITDFSAPLIKLTKLCRFYFAWLYLTREELSTFQEHLDQQSWRDVHRLVADVLTLLVPHVVANSSAALSKYLLLEDNEALGLRPLSKPALPLFLLQTPNDEPPATPKPRKDVSGYSFQPRTENLWRIRDMVLCGYHLASSRESPLLLTMAADGRKMWLYPENGVQPMGPPLDEALLSQSLASLSASSDKDAMSHNPSKSPSDNTAHVAPPGDPAGSTNNEPVSLPVPSTGTGRKIQQDRPYMPTSRTGTGRESQHAVDYLPTTGTTTAVKSRLELSYPDVGTENSAMDHLVSDMLKDLVCDTDEHDDSLLLSNSVHADTSYGMNSSTANDVFAQYANSAAKSSFTRAAGARAPIPSAGQSTVHNRSIPSLPWDYFLSANDGSSDDPGPSHMRGQNVPRTVASPNPAMGHVGGAFGQMSPPTYVGFGREAGLGAPFNPASRLGADRRVSNAGPVRMGTSPSGLSPSTPSPDFATSQRTAALDNLRSQLSAQYGAGAGASMPSSGPSSYTPEAMQSIRGSQRPSGSGPPPFPEARRSINAQVNEDSWAQPVLRTAERTTSRGAAAGRSQQQHLGPTGGAATTGYAGGRRASGLASPLGGSRINHMSPSPPLAGSPSHRSHGSMESFADQFSSIYNPSEAAGGSVASPSAWALSNSSQIWAGTPALAQQPARAGMVACNGNYFNGSTAFGRSGENNRADPTHFRNKIKEMGGAEKANAYDQAILRGAMWDNSKPPQK